MQQPGKALPIQAVTRFDRILAIGSLLLLAAVLIAITKGQHDWAKVPPIIWLHLLTMVLALALTPVILLRRRGDARHRILGYVWIGALMLTAIDSFFIRLSGGFSIIHILSVWTLIQLPIILFSARRHNLVRHRRAVRGMVTGALLIAGFFTFPFDRMLGQWLFG